LLILFGSCAIAFLLIVTLINTRTIQNLESERNFYRDKAITLLVDGRYGKHFFYARELEREYRDRQTR
jgi:hypothetical protein